MVSRKTKIIIGVAAAAAAAAALIIAAKKMHEKGYDKKAVAMLHKYSAKIKSEAHKLAKKKTKKKR